MNPKIQMLKCSKSQKKKNKKIKEFEYFEPKNYWNKTKHIYVYVITQQRNIEKDELSSKE